jgi:hypothetical protein
MPLLRAKIRVLAVPRSIARSVEKYRRKAPNILESSGARHARRHVVALLLGRFWTGWMDVFAANAGAFAGVAAKAG